MVGACCGSEGIPLPHHSIVLTVTHFEEQYQRKYLSLSLLSFRKLLLFIVFVKYEVILLYKNVFSFSVCVCCMIVSVDLQFVVDVIHWNVSACCVCRVT